MAPSPAAHYVQGLQRTDLESTDGSLFVNVQVAHRTLRVLVDTGANVTILPASLWEDPAFRSLGALESSGVAVKMVDGRPLPIAGEVELDLQVGNVLLKHRVLLADI